MLLHPRSERNASSTGHATARRCSKGSRSWRCLSQCEAVTRLILKSDERTDEAVEAALEPWSATLDWRDHICGPPARRRRSMTGLALSGCAHGTSAAAACLAVQGNPNVGPLAPTLRPSTRELVELLASQTLKQLSKVPVAEGACFISDAGRVSPAGRRFVAGLGRQRCAVVGNSPGLLGRNRGREIDAHDVVLRYNFAPTRGYEADVGTRTTVRVMGRSWVVNESEVGATCNEGQPLLIHRYNNVKYLQEDRTLNRAFPIAALEPYFARTSFSLRARARAAIAQALGRQGAAAPDAADAKELRRYHAQTMASSGFAGVLYSLHRCSAVSLYGFDLNGSTPGHYFSDTSEGVIPRLQTQLLREPHRRASFSVDTGIAGVRLLHPDDLSKLPVHRRERLLDFSRRDAEVRDFISQQYSNSTTEQHPFTLERGLLRAFTERGCVRLV